MKFIALYENASKVSLGGKKVRRSLPQTSQTLRQLLEEQAPINNFGKNLLVPRNTAAGKIDNDVILLLWQPHCKWNTIITNFHPYLLQQWWYFFQVFVNGNVVNAQTWKVVPMKNPVKPSSITLTFNCQSYLFICCMAYRFYFFHEFFYLLFIIIIICYFEVAQGTHL